MKFAKLKYHPLVEDVENEAMDDGRFFVHLKSGYVWDFDPFDECHVRSFSSIGEARDALKNYVRPEKRSAERSAS